MTRVVIVGGGVSGLVASYVFKKRAPSVEVIVLEPRSAGGEFLAGGLKYIHRSDNMVKMFEELDLAHSHYTVQGGILLRGEVESYPKCFTTLPKDEAVRVQADHYRKTRRTEGGRDLRKAMNDPAATKPRRALRCNFEEMVKTLARRATLWRETLIRIRPKTNEVAITGSKRLGYDFLVLTVPLWITKQAAPFFVPHGMAMRLNAIQVLPARDRFARWDYVYTPYTPADAVHRFSPSGMSYSVEVNGELDKTKLESDLNFIFNEGYAIEGVREGLKGHLLPLDAEPEWPQNVAPLGRFAKWDSRATTDVTLDDATVLVERWLG